MNRRRPRSRIKLNPVPVQHFPDRSNLTRKDVANLVGISEAYFSQLMNGERNPYANIRSRFQEVMGVHDFDRLFIVELVDE